MEVRIVPTRLEDIDDIMILEELSFTIPWSKKAFIEEVTRNKFAVYYSAIADGKVIGYAGMWKIIDEGHITNIAVHPSYRRRHVGSLLLEKLMEACRENDITSMTLECRESNTAARRLYEKHGFRVEGRRRGYYSDNDEDALVFWYKSEKSG